MLPPGLTAERVAEVKLLMVAAASHPLSQYRGVIPAEELARHTQLVLTDRSHLSDGQQFGVMAPSTWRLADLAAKHAFLLRGLASLVIHGVLQFPAGTSDERFVDSTLQGFEHLFAMGADEQKAGVP